MTLTSWKWKLELIQIFGFKIDSFMALSIIESMKKLAKTGKTIVFTIHQPSSDLFEMFDKICFVTEGRLAFFGDRNQAYTFFAQQGYKCPSNYNPAEYYIKTLSISPFDKKNCLKKVYVRCFMFSTDYLSQ
jgi:ABC-type multidrug transport system ATPase subunit